MEDVVAKVGSEELIVVKQLPVIEDKLDEALISVQDRLHAMSGLVATEENYKEVKKVRSDLNKEFDHLEFLRKQVKKALEEPYKKFESGAYKRIADEYKRAIAQVDSSVKQVEEELIRQRKEELRKYYDDYRVSLGLDESIADARRSGIKVGLSGSMTSLKKQAKEYLDKLDGDLKAIDTMEYRDEVLIAYRDLLNVSDAVRVVNERHKRIEEERQRREAMETARKEKEAQEAAVDAVIVETAPERSEVDSGDKGDILAAPTEKVAVEQSDGDLEQVYSAWYVGVGFWGTKNQLVGLKEELRQSILSYCEENGMKYVFCKKEEMNNG